MIPKFRSDGYLPEGLHFATEAQATFRFGTLNRRRRYLVLRMRRWVAFFSRTREVNGRLKGLVEIEL